VDKRGHKKLVNADSLAKKAFSPKAQAAGYMDALNMQRTTMLSLCMRWEIRAKTLMTQINPKFSQMIQIHNVLKCADNVITDSPRIKRNSSEMVASLFLIMELLNVDIFGLLEVCQIFLPLSNT